MSGNSTARIVLLLVVYLLSLAGCHTPAGDSRTGRFRSFLRHHQPVIRIPPAKGAHADVGWTIAGDQHVRLSDYQNKVLILDFYATWCEPCRDSIPHLVELQQRYGEQGLQVIGLNVGGRGDLDKVPAFAREFHIKYQLGVPDSQVSRALHRR